MIELPGTAYTRRQCQVEVIIETVERLTAVTQSRAQPEPIHPCVSRCNRSHQATGRMTSRMHVGSAPSLDAGMTMFSTCQDRMLCVLQRPQCGAELHVFGVARQTDCKRRNKIRCLEEVLLESLGNVKLVNARQASGSPLEPLLHAGRCFDVLSTRIYVQVAL